MVTGNESQAGISPHGIEGVLTCHENPPRGFPSLGLLPLAAKLGLRARLEISTPAGIPVYSPGGRPTGQAFLGLDNRAFGNP